MKKRVTKTGVIKTYYRTFCTCYFGRLCGTTHKTWKDYTNDKALINYMKESFGQYDIDLDLT